MVGSAPLLPPQWLLLSKLPTFPPVCFTIGKAKVVGIIIQLFFVTVAELCTTDGPLAVRDIRDENGLPVLNK
ncbi:MAG: hypothetical protein NTV33_09915 [Coprothermobacterota bacterium]|jgi:hypothetical protein|nr:hypothetical protein [Coprothermobacterota bacterium]